jgi:chromosome segregation ATPase
LVADYDRGRFENNELKRKLEQHANDASRSIERTSLESRLRQARESLKFERDRMVTCEADLSRISRELNETRRDYAALLRQKDTTNEELTQFRDANQAQKSALANLNLSVQELNNALADKNAELANFRKEIEVSTSCFSNNRLMFSDPP